VDVEDESAFIFEEEWMTREDLENHLRSDHYSVLNGAMRLLRIAPDIRFNSVASSAGLETIKAALA
jgi:quinol monooxygenase YgiN